MPFLRSLARPARLHLALFTLLAACGGAGPAAVDAAAPVDATKKPDAGADTGKPPVADATPDTTATEAGPGPADASDAAKGHDAIAVDASDAGWPVEAGADAPQDVAVAQDAGLDTGVDSGFDAGVDSGYDAGPPAVEYVGRIDMSDPAGPRFEWSGTQVIMRFTGTAVTVNMTDYGNYFDVYIDGTLQANPIVGTSGVTAYVLASGLPQGTHEVIMDRRTEAYVSTTQILSVTLPSATSGSPPGTLLAPRERPARRIEAIGDSITCGLGVLGVGPTCDPTNANEDHTEAYEAVAARALGADLHTVSWSGKGVFENYGNDPTSTIPELYPYALPNEPSTATEWTFSKWIPDVVVIDLGTNDFWNGDPGTGYETAYVAFLATIRSNYPAALIVCENGPMLLSDDHAQAETYINDAIAARAALGDTNVKYLDLGIQSADNGYACDYHPSAITHEMMAMDLETLLHTELGW